MIKTFIIRYTKTSANIKDLITGSKGNNEFHRGKHGDSPVTKFAVFQGISYSVICYIAFFALEKNTVCKMHQALEVNVNHIRIMPPF